MSKRASSKAPDNGKPITKAELEKHNTADDCWCHIHGKVYDVTAFLEKHPGGPDVMLDVAGADGTSEFDDIGHTPEARKQMEDFYIGDMEPGAFASSSKSGGDDSSSSSNMVVPVVLLAILALVYFLLQTEEEA